MQNNFSPCDLVLSDESFKVVDGEVVPSDAILGYITRFYSMQINCGKNQKAAGEAAEEQLKALKEGYVVRYLNNSERN